MQIRNAVKHISRGAAGAAMVVVLSASASAAPVGSASIDLVSQARASAVEKAAYRKCWRRDGVRHCRRSAERPRLNGFTKEQGYGYPMATRGPRRIRQEQLPGGRQWNVRAVPALVRTDPDTAQCVAALKLRQVPADARAALRMIREVEEHNAPPGSVPSEEYVEPPFTKGAEVLVKGILAMVETKG